MRRAACCVGEWRGAAVCVSLYDDTNTILRFHSTESDESSGALWCFLVGQLGGICRGQRGSRHHCTMRRFSTESTVRRSSSRHDTRVDEAAMQAKLKELRGLMASEHAARETVLDMATLNGGSIWQTSRRPEERGRAEPIRPSVGVSGGRGGRTAQPHRTGPRLRDLSAEDMSLVERARMRASTDANARPSSHASRPGDPTSQRGGPGRRAGRRACARRWTSSTTSAPTSSRARWAWSRSRCRRTPRGRARCRRRARAGESHRGSRRRHTAPKEEGLGPRV